MLFVPTWVLVTRDAKTVTTAAVSGRRPLDLRHLGGNRFLDNRGRWHLHHWPHSGMASSKLGEGPFWLCVGLGGGNAMVKVLPVMR